MSTNKTIFPLEPEVIEVYLDEVKHPVAWNKAVTDLANSMKGVPDAIETAKNIIRRTPFKLELAYSTERGLWAIDADALASLEDEVVDPYTGENVEVLTTDKL